MLKRQIAKGKKFELYPEEKLLDKDLKKYLDGMAYREMFAALQEMQWHGEDNKSLIQTAICGIVLVMERYKSLIQQATRDGESAMKLLENTFNKVQAQEELMMPLFGKMIEGLRDKRNAAKFESTQIVKTFTSLREIFDDKNYQRHIEQLKELVLVMDKMVTLVNSGAFNTVVESLLKLRHFEMVYGDEGDEEETGETEEQPEDRQRNKGAKKGK
jgi:hypothetical protein